MLNKLNILIIGGDARYLEVIDNLLKADANVHLAGYDQLTFDNPNVHQSKLDEIEFGLLDSILLPVSGTTEDGKVELAPYSSNSIFLTKEMIDQTPTTVLYVQEFRILFWMRQPGTENLSVYLRVMMSPFSIPFQQQKVCCN